MVYAIQSADTDLYAVLWRVVCAVFYVFCVLVAAQSHPKPLFATIGVLLCLGSVFFIVFNVN